MPHTWGSRYFEKRPSETLKNNNSKPFHQVYGNRSVRTFQPDRPSRGRFSSRGRGRPGRPNSCNSERNFRSRQSVPDARRNGIDFDTNARTPDIFPQGRKRPSFDQRNFDGKRKKRYVPGGLIPKFERIEEYGGETFCDVCNEAFRDVNAKALHDRSYKHRRNYGYLRHENRNKTDEHTEDIITPIQQSEDDQRKNFEEGTISFLSRGRAKLPKDFEEWAERSLAEGKKAAEEARDPSLLQAIKREIVDVFRVNDKNCTLRRVCWTRRELATGRAYRLSQSAPATLPIIQDAKIHIKVPAMSKKEEEKPRANQPLPTTTAHSPPTDIIELEADDDHNTSPSVAGPPNTYIPTKSAPVQQAHLPYREVPLLFQPSRAGEILLSCCETPNREAVFANYYNVFGIGATRSSDREQEEPESIKSSLTMFRELRRQYQSEEYVYSDIITDLSTVAKQLENSGKHIELLRQILRMQIEIALQCGEFRDCFEPCSKFVGTYSQRRHRRGTSATFVGHWLVSLLFKNNSGTSRKHFPALLEVAQEMRKFPVGALDDIWVYEAIQAMKATLGNNWCGFFGRSMASIVHSPKSTSKQILEGLVPFMRERALIVMTNMNVHSMLVGQTGVLKDIRGDRTRRLLGWDASGDVAESTVEMKEFVSSLPQPFEFVKGEDYSDCIRWKGKHYDGLNISGDSDAREDVLAKWSKPIVLDED